MRLECAAKYRTCLMAGSASMGSAELANSPTHFLHAGQVHVSPKPQSIVLILGSCAAVCIWDYVHGIGGATHYLLPEWDGRGVASPRYGSVAIAELLQKLAAAGASNEALRAKVFGGGCLFKGNGATVAGLESLGHRNLETALAILAKERIQVVGVQPAGSRGQRVVFQTDSGGSLVTSL